MVVVVDLAVCVAYQGLLGISRPMFEGDQDPYQSRNYRLDEVLPARPKDPHCKPGPHDDRSG